MNKKKNPEKEKSRSAKKAKKAESREAEVNIGLVGHVDHGKTTLVKSLSGKWTDTHSEEIKKGITIRLGYADIEVRKCPKCKGAEAWSTKKKCPVCGSETKLKRIISLVDAPGHESLMATMLSGAALMDGALLMIAANEKCPQPQTREHLKALEIVGIKNIIIVQNKIDVVDEKRALESYNEIKEFIKNTPFKDAPIIPISAQQGANIDILLQTIEEHIKTPDRDTKADAIMIVARSFDINMPGIKGEEIKGGILGGGMKQGILRVGDEIEIRPGIAVEEQNKQVWKPIKTTIKSIICANENVDELSPGGTGGIMTGLDPSIVKGDALAGSLVGKPGMLPPVWDTLSLNTTLLERVVGAKEELEVKPIVKNEILMLNVNAAATVGVVTSSANNEVTLALKRSVCAEKGSRVTLSRRISGRFRLIGYGIIE